MSPEPIPSPVTEEEKILDKEIETEIQEEIKEKEDVKEDLRKSLKSVGGCNANVCFAIDGSGAISPEAFTSQKNFVLDVVSVIAVDEPVELAAVQYATRRRAIKRLTNKVPEFVLAVNGTYQLGGWSRPAAGIAFCNRQLWRWNKANKIVLLGNGKSDLGRSAVRSANRFRDRNGDLSVVAAGDADDQKLLAIAGGRKDRVFDVTSFLDVLALQEVIEQLVKNICLKDGGPPLPGIGRRNMKRARLERRRRKLEKKLKRRERRRERRREKRRQRKQRKERRWEKRRERRHLRREKKNRWNQGARN